MLSIELRDLHFHGHHGIYEEERKVMNTFEVNLSVRYDEGKTDFENVKDIISYVNLYEIVKKHVGVPVFLLEKICRQIIVNIKNQYPSVLEITISIYKLRPPIESFTGKAGVTMQRIFEA